MSTPQNTESRLDAIETALLRLIEWSGAGQAMAAEVARLRGGVLDGTALDGGNWQDGVTGDEWGMY